MVLFHIIQCFGGVLVAPFAPEELSWLTRLQLYRHYGQFCSNGKEYKPLTIIEKDVFTSLYINYCQYCAWIYYIKYIYTHICSYLGVKGLPFLQPLPPTKPGSNAPRDIGQTLPGLHQMPRLKGIKHRAVYLAPTWCSTPKTSMESENIPLGKGETSTNNNLLDSVLVFWGCIVFLIFWWVGKTRKKMKHIHILSTCVYKTNTNIPLLEVHIVCLSSCVKGPTKEFMPENNLPSCNLSKGTCDGSTGNLSAFASYYFEDFQMSCLDDHFGILHPGRLWNLKTTPL